MRDAGDGVGDAADSVHAHGAGRVVAMSGGVAVTVPSVTSLVVREPHCPETAFGPNATVFFRDLPEPARTFTAADTVPSLVSSRTCGIIGSRA